jgi:cation diffusion facilitator CzcD-associated flavoprotein CzcO
MQDSSRSAVAVIGAGPYGISIAAHLRAAGVDFRIFGKPMHRWQCHMPEGMFLKSEPCASSLSDPAGLHTLERYCLNNDLPYGMQGPVSRHLFVQYALCFQRHLVPNLEEVMVAGVDTIRNGYELRLADGTTATAGKVVVATGLEHTAYVPSVLGRLPSELLSHAADHHYLSGFRGREVVVIGGGQSALETAALLSEKGASVQLLVRKPSLIWNPVPNTARRSLYQRLRRPASKLGTGLQLWAFANGPGLFRHLPQPIRANKVRTVLGPAGAWWLRDRIEGQLQVLLAHSVQRVEERGGRAVLHVSRQDGSVLDLAADHVIAATGYRFSIELLPFLSPTLRSRLRAEQRSPTLSSSFESSVPGLYFTGLASANCFGPAMRFIHGAGYTAQRISSHIAAVSKSRPALAGAHGTR